MSFALTLLAAAISQDLAPEPVTVAAPAAALEALEALEARIQRIDAQVAPTVVAILDEGPPSGELEEAATATIVTRDGYVLTAAHCLNDPGETVQLKLADGRVVDAETLGKDRQSDFGLLKIKGEGQYPFSKMHPTSSELAADEVLLMYGFPDGPEPGRKAVARLGTFLGVHGDGMLRTSCTMMPGDSGGPIFDLDGMVVGINSEIELPLDQNYHVQTEAVLASWDRLVAKEVWGADPFGEEAGDWMDWDEGSMDPEGEYEDGEFEYEEPDLDEFLSYATDRADGVAEPAPAPKGYDMGKLLPKGRQGLMASMGAMTKAAPRVSITSRQDGTTQVILGVPVGDGQGAPGPYVVSKSSAISDDTIRCTLPGLGTDTATAVHRDRDTDLVLLKLANVAAPPVLWGDATSMGTLVSVPGVSAGMIGADVHRTQRKDWGYLGVELDRSNNTALVADAPPGQPAATAGIARGDVIVEVADQSVTESNDLIQKLRGTDPGETVEVIVERDGEELALTVTLGSRGPGGDMFHVAYMTDTSPRRGGFPSVFRHDAHLEPAQCGGPLYGLHGKALGLNIARADRTGTLALPAAAVQAFLAKAIQQAASQEEQ